MIFSKKPLITKKASVYKINYTSFASGMNAEVDDNLLPHKHAKITYNFKASNGALMPSYGFGELFLPKSWANVAEKRQIYYNNINADIQKLWCFKCWDASTNLRDDHIIFCTGDNQMRYIRVVDLSPLNAPVTMGEELTGQPKCVSYRLNGTDSFIMTCPNGKMQVYRVNLKTPVFPNAPKIVSLCVHYERLFAIQEGERTRLTFSANLDPTNWNISTDNAGFIDLLDERGSMNKVLSFNDYVYVFRDYGVTRISAYGAQDEFSVTQLFVSSVKIYGDSVCACGDRIIFLAKDGLHAFDGYNTVKLNLGIDSLFAYDNSNSKSCFFNDSYFLACRMNFNDGKTVECESVANYVNNVLLEYDFRKNEINVVRGVDIKDMVAVMNEGVSELVACFRGEKNKKLGMLTNDGKFFGTVLPKCWASPKSNLSQPNKQKRIKEVNIKSEYPSKVVITTDKETKTYNVCAKKSTQRIKTNVVGELVQICFETNYENANISSPQIMVGI
ncbi:MAG: hypothetical protein RR140_03645 [Clostridia bacterium]